MNSDAFQTLKQIYDANVFVQKATREDDEIVSDLETHEKKALPWMQEVLVALNEAHDEMLAAEGASGQMTSNMAGQTAARTSQALSTLASDVASETNGTAGGALGTDVDQTVAMMNEQFATSSDNDNATLQGIQNSFSGNLNGATTKINEFASELNAIETVTANVSGSIGAVQKSVDHLIKMNEKMSERGSNGAQQKMMAAFSSLANDSFIETHADTRVDDGHTHAGRSAVNKANAGLPARPRLRSLLAQHNHLAKLNLGLSVRHDELGKEVSEVAEIGRKFNEVSE